MPADRGLRAAFAFLVTGGLLTAGEADAQGSIAGRVLAASSRVPIRGAEVRVARLNVFAVADTLGRFVLRGLPHGDHVVITPSPAGHRRG